MSNPKISEENIPPWKDSHEVFIRFVGNEDFSVRASNVLLQNCNSLEDFTSLTKEKLLSFPNCGRKTVREILTFLATNCVNGKLASPLLPEKQLTAPPQNTSAYLLPLFTSENLTGFSAEQLHPGFQGHIKIKDVPLSVLTKNALNNLQVETIGEVMLTPGSFFLKQPNFGKNCLHELHNFVLELCTARQLQEHFALPPTEDSLQILPLFSSNKYIGIDVDDLHEGFQASTKLSDLIISRRTSNILNDLGMISIGEVMLMPGNDLLCLKNFGRKSLNELREIVLSLCLLDSKEEEQDTVAYSSYDAMVECFIKQCVERRRDQELFIHRFCFTEGKAPTLEELGQQFSITRERARQILKKGLLKLSIKENLDKLYCFWRELDTLIVQGGGLIKLGTLSNVLQAQYEWPTPPFPPALGQFLLLKKPNAILKQDDDLFEIKCSCTTCTLPGEQLQKIDFEKTESFHIQVLAAKLSNYCQRQCPEGKPVSTFFPAYIERFI